MRRKRLLVVVLVLIAGGVFLYRRLRTPPPAAVAPPAPPPAAESRGPPLQMDAEGTYLPGYRFTVSGFRFAGFSLRPEPLVFFARTSGGGAQPAGCRDAQIRPETLRLRCTYPQLGTVTIEGRFLTRRAIERLDVDVVSAMVTVRSGRGDVLYQARDAFVWEPAP